MSALRCVAGGALLVACELAAPLHRPADARATDVADADVDPLDDPFARAIVRTLPPGEPREEVCDGQDDDGDGRVDEGWDYVERGCLTGCSPPPRVEQGVPSPRRHRALAASFDGTYGTVIWREGFIQGDNGIVYVHASWDGRFFSGDRGGFAQWRRLNAVSPTQPARAGSIVRAGKHALALWGHSSIACTRRRDSCQAELAVLDETRENRTEVGVFGFPGSVPRGSGLIPYRNGAIVAFVNEVEGFSVYEATVTGNQVSVAHPNQAAAGVDATRIGVVRGTRWGEAEIAWVYEYTGVSGIPALMVLWTDLRGSTTRAAVELVREGTFDPTWTEQLAVADGVLLVIHWIAGRGLFLTRFDVERGTRETLLLDRAPASHRTAWDGATLHVCFVGGIEGANQVLVRRYSSRGETLGTPTPLEGRWADCVIAAHAGVALVGVAHYGVNGEAAVTGFGCPLEAGP